MSAPFAEVIPQNEQAEKASVCLLARSPLLIVDCPWKPALFNHPTCRLLFRTVVEAIAAQEPTDYTAVTARLIANGKLKEVGGDGNVYSILNCIDENPLAKPNSEADKSSLKYYFALLSEAHVARETLNVAKSNISDLAQMELSPAEFAEKVASAAQGPEIATRATLKEQVDSFYADLERTEPREVFSTGVTRLDLILNGGIHRGQLLVVAAETSGGKSILLGQAALACAQAGKSVALFSLEMPATDILARMAANLAGCRIKSAREKTTPQERDAMGAAVNQFYSFR